MVVGGGPDDDEDDDEVDEETGENQELRLERLRCTSPVQWKALGDMYAQ